MEAEKRAEFLFLLSCLDNPRKALMLLLPSSLNTLEAANHLKRVGAIAPSTQLWAVANPNVEKDASLAEQKVQWGQGALSDGSRALPR
eukprot:scaffold79262_cov17-Tisochrysis_lutea.AAC.1